MVVWFCMWMVCINFVGWYVWNYEDINIFICGRLFFVVNILNLWLRKILYFIGFEKCVLKNEFIRIFLVV